MPTYDYQCRSCDYQAEYVCKIADRPTEIPCPCGGQMRQVLLPTAIQTDDIVGIPWLQEFAATRKEVRHGGRPIETRAEYRQYLKDKNLQPCGDGMNLSEV